MEFANKNEAGRTGLASLAAISRGVKEQGLLETACHNAEVVAVSKLISYKANIRTHSRKQIRQIADSITRFGFCNPVLIDNDYQIIAGHGRVEAAKILGLAEVPALRLSHLSDAEKRAYIIADNRLAELAGWDWEALAIELQGLLELNFDLALTGFEIDDVDIVRDEAVKPRRKNKAPERDRATLTSGLPVSRAGDVWLLGPHQLRCGDTVNKSSNISIDAALRAWQSAAAEPAVLCQTGRTFAEVEKQRGESNEAIRKSRAATGEAA